MLHCALSLRPITKDAELYTFIVLNGSIASIAIPTVYREEITPNRGTFSNVLYAPFEEGFATGYKVHVLKTRYEMVIDSLQNLKLENYQYLPPNVQKPVYLNHLDEQDLVHSIWIRNHLYFLEFIEALGLNLENLRSDQKEFSKMKDMLATAMLRDPDYQRTLHI